jgi:hypothetical protein
MVPIHTWTTDDVQLGLDPPVSLVFVNDQLTYQKLEIQGIHDLPEEDLDGLSPVGDLGELVARSRPLC